MGNIESSSKITIRYVIPQLQIEYSDRAGYVIASNGQVYKKNSFFTNSGLWKTVENNKKSMSVSVSSNDQIIYINLDGSLQAVIGKKSYPVTANTPVTSVTSYKGYVWITGTNGLCYISTTNDWNNIKATSWKQMTGTGLTNIRWMSAMMSQTDAQIFITNDNKLLYVPDTYTTQTNLVATIIVQRDCVSAAMNNGASIWWVDSAGVITFLKSSTAQPITIPSPSQSKGAIAIYANNSSGIGMIGKDNNIYYASGGNIYNNGINWTLSGVNCLNVLTYDKYYGNSTPVTKPPFVINLTGQIPVHNWRSGIETPSTGCGYNSDCGSFVPVTGSDANLAVESPDESISYAGQRRSNCGVAGQYYANCWVPETCLTHVFGESGGPKISPNGSIPTNNTQYSMPNALNLQIIPINKKMNTPDGTMKTYAIGTTPTFASLSFNIPNPTEVDIDAKIPMILLGYYQKEMLSLEQLNEYMSKYAFTPIKQDNKTIPRYMKSIGTGIMPNVPINQWKNTIVNDDYFNIASLKYCSGDTLTTKYCMDYCKDPKNNCDINLEAFCKTGGTGKLPSGYKPGKFLSTKITKAILDKAYPKYSDPVTKNTCGCFMPNDYYNLIDIKAFQDTKSSADDYERLFKQGAIGGMAKCDPFTSCTSGGDVVSKRSDTGTCPSKNIQNCIQNNTVSADNGEGNTFTNQQTMNCVQNILNPSTTNAAPPIQTLPNKVIDPTIKPGKKPNTKPVDTKPVDIKPVDTKPVDTKPNTTTTPKSSNVTLYIIIAIIVMLLLGGGAYILL
jgi:hypothetical protein